MLSHFKPREKRLIFLIDQNPIHLNPFVTTDANGQRFVALLYRGLTQINRHLKIVGDLAHSFHSSDSNKSWIFPLKDDLGRDSLGRPITPELLEKCLRNYFFSEKPSPLSNNVAGLKSITLTKRNGRSEIQFQFERPAPYFARDASVFRFFYESKETPTPCTAQSTDESSLVYSSMFSITQTSPNSFLLKKDGEKIEILSIKDETARAIQLMNHPTSLTLNAFSSARHQYMSQLRDPDKKPKFSIQRVYGTSVSYMLFQQEDPVLSKLEIRKAIALAARRLVYTQTKLKNETEPALSFLHPSLDESLNPEHVSNPLRYESPAWQEEAITLLDQANLPETFPRLRLRMTLSNYRDNQEYAQFLRQNLSKIGIDLDLEILDFATALNRVQTGRFQLSISRFVGIQDGSILQRVLHSKSKDNRARYRSAMVDDWLDQATTENMHARIITLRKVQLKVLEDLPYLPLWFWSNVLITNRLIVSQNPLFISPIGDYLFLKELLP